MFQTRKYLKNRGPVSRPVSVSSFFFLPKVPQKDTSAAFLFEPVPVVRSYGSWPGLNAPPAASIWFLVSQ